MTQPIPGAPGALPFLTTDPHEPAALTVLRAPGMRLCKIVRADAAPTPAQVPKLYDFHPVLVPTLDALHALLGRLAGAHDCCIVRAVPANPSCVTGQRRLLHTDPETREVPTFCDVPRRIVALDMDGAARPEGCDPRDLAACHAALLPHLPPELQAAGCIVQATGSHGIKPGIRFRLWFLLDRPCFGADLAAWLAEVPALDPTGFRPVQIHYTATPLFADGAADPLPVRLLPIAGPAASPPSLDAYRRPPAPARDEGWRYDPGRPDRAVGRFAGLLRTVATAPEGRRHPALFWASCRAGEMVAVSALGRDAAADALARAAMDGGGKDERNARKTAAAGIARGMVEAL